MEGAIVVVVAALDASTLVHRLYEFHVVVISKVRRKYPGNVIKHHSAHPVHLLP